MYVYVCKYVYIYIYMHTYTYMYIHLLYTSGLAAGILPRGSFFLSAAFGARV